MSTTASQQALPGGAPGPTVSPTRLLSHSMVLLSFGHMMTDMFSSAVPTLQPILSERYGLSLAQAGLLGGTFMFASSVLQLPFGIVSDRLNSRLFSVLGPLAAGVFLSILGWADGFGALLALTFLGGVGVAAFHPQSTTQATHLSGNRRGMGVALFITAGTFGLALGPPYFTSVIRAVGFDRFAVAMIPALLAVALLAWKLQAPEPHPHDHSRHIDWGKLRAKWRPLGLHYGLVVLRSVVQLGFGQFLTLYLVRERAMSIEAASLVLSLFFLAAATGSFAGGGLADRIGGKRVVVLSMLASAPFLSLFLLTTGWISYAGLFFGAMILLLTIPVNVVMAQELVPSQRGMVTALMMGFAWGIAGITFIPAIGWIADRVGLEAVLWGVALAPLAGVLPALRLPTTAAHR